MPDVFVSPQSEEESSESIIPGKDPTTEREKSSLPYHSHSRLSAFSFYPDHVDFETREKEEKIILLLRQHPIVNVKWIAIAAASLFVPTIIKYFGVLSSLHAGFELVVTLAWYLVTMAFALEKFMDWYFNVYIVTNFRVVDVDFYNLIDKKVSDAAINKIQDVSYTAFGVPRMLFNFGDVFIQTAAEISEFDFLAVPNPEKVVKVINDLIPNPKTK